MPFSLNDDDNGMIFPTPQKKRRKKSRIHKQISVNPQNYFKEPPEVKLMDLEEEDILSHGLDFALGEDCSQLFQSFEIFDQDQLFSQPDNEAKNDLDKHNKSNNLVDQANLYLNLSNKM